MRGELALYCRDLSRVALLSPEEEHALGLRIQEARRTGHADTEARDALVRANLRLVFRMARRYLGRGLGLDDLVQEGTLGLLKAAETFDPSRARFTTHAAYWIKMHLVRGVEDRGRLIRVPGYQRRLWVQYERAEARLAMESGGTHPDPAAVLEMVARTRTYRAYRLGNPKAMLPGVRACRALVGLLGGPGHPTGPNPVDHATAPESVACRELEAASLHALESLPAREQTVLRLRCGLNGPPLTQAEVGLLLGISRERARQLELSALRRLRLVLGVELAPRRAVRKEEAHGTA